MLYYTNHCWCRDSNWGGLYDCRHIVSIDRIPENKTFYDEPTEDWKNLIVKKNRILDVTTYEETKKFDKKTPDDVLRQRNIKTTFSLKKEVLDWLTENIKDKDEEKGWCIGSDLYNINSALSFSIFFKRQKDALDFIKQWSVYKKPTIYFNYFKDIRKELNLDTMKLEKKS